MEDKKNDFDVIVPMDDSRTKILEATNVLNRLINLEHDYKSGYDNLISWVYSEFKAHYSYVEIADDVPLTSVLKSIPEDKFNTFLTMISQCEAAKFNEHRKIDMKEEEHTSPVLGYISFKAANVPGYISFKIARYALTDVIEELHKSKAKDIIVTKIDDNLVVKYKPN